MVVSEAFVALDEGRRVVGFIAFGQGWVNHLYVLPEFHGLGTSHGNSMNGEDSRS